MRCVNEPREGKLSSTLKATSGTAIRTSDLFGHQLLNSADHRRYPALRVGKGYLWIAKNTSESSIANLVARPSSLHKMKYFRHLPYSHKYKVLFIKYSHLKNISNGIMNRTLILLMEE